MNTLKKLENLTERKLAFFNRLNQEGDALIVPLVLWNTYIPRPFTDVSGEKVEFMTGDDIVIAEKDFFTTLIKNLHNIEFEAKRLSMIEGGFWVTTKLQAKMAFHRAMA